MRIETGGNVRCDGAFGDLLVTSSTPGHAVKADPGRLGSGMVLGKALELFEGSGAGVIKVLVSVK
jgi:hypothetical protein